MRMNTISVSEYLLRSVIKLFLESSVNLHVMEVLEDVSTFVRFKVQIRTHKVLPFLE